MGPKEYRERGVRESEHYREGTIGEGTKGEWT